MSNELPPVSDTEVKSFTGWDAFVKNDWTEWAENHGLTLSHQKIRKAPGKRIRRNNVTPVLSRDYKILRRLIRSPIHDWYDKRSGAWEFLPIDEYKKKFGGSRPEWARTFSERGISKRKIADYRRAIQFVLPYEPGGRLDRFRSVEREYVISKLEKNKMVIERLLDGSGQCKRVTTVHILGMGLYPHIRQEDWISKGVWHVTLDRELKWPDELTGDSYTRYIRKPKPWSSYLKK